MAIRNRSATNRLIGYMLEADRFQQPFIMRLIATTMRRTRFSWGCCHEQEVSILLRGTKYLPCYHINVCVQFLFNSREIGRIWIIITISSIIMSVTIIHISNQDFPSSQREFIISRWLQESYIKNFWLDDKLFLNSSIFRNGSYWSRKAIRIKLIKSRKIDFIELLISI